MDGGLRNDHCDQSRAVMSPIAVFEQFIEPNVEELLAVAETSDLASLENGRACPLQDLDYDTPTNNRYIYDVPRNGTPGEPIYEEINHIGSNNEDIDRRTQRQDDNSHCAPHFLQEIMNIIPLILLILHKIAVRLSVEALCFIWATSQCRSCNRKRYTSCRR